MKRIFPLILAIVILASIIPAAHAVIWEGCQNCENPLTLCPDCDSDTYCPNCDICTACGYETPDNDTNDHTEGTLVVFEAANNESYTITVPAKLNPGQSGTVTLAGSWPSNKTVSVTAESTVTLTNSILASDQKVLDVTFLGISKAGNDITAQTFTESVSVEDIENALFGTWTGIIEYNVELSDMVVAVPVATFSDGVTLTWDELQLEENGTKYGYTPSALTETAIRDMAFYECDALIEMNIPSGITSIGFNAFAGCSSLRNVNFPNNITDIGNYSFYECAALASLNIPESVTNIGEGAFIRCNSLVSVNIPSGVKTIKVDTFAQCQSLTTVNLPEGLNKIDDMVFRNCVSLSNINIPSSVTSIGDETFSDCSSLTSITLSENITNIGADAFYNCASLINITFRGTTTQWKAIPLNSGWNRFVPATKVVCSDGTVAI